MLPLTYRLESGAGTAVGVVGGELTDPAGSFDLAVDLGSGHLRPGLINGHDHLHRNHYPRLGAPPYTDAYAWGRDIHRGWAEEVARGRALDRLDALRFGALKNLLGGVTTVVHHDRWEPAFDRFFPVRVARVRTVHSTGLEPGLEGAHSGDPELPLCIHVAEGTAPAVADEVRVLDRRGLLDARLIAVHAVGVDDDGVDRLRRAGAAVVWCPTSNVFLYGRTAPVGLLRSGIDVLLGSDALLTGAGTLLDELRAARRHGALDERRLLDAVGPVSARRLSLPRPVLRPGAPADLVHLRRPVLEATAADIGLVVVAGRPRLGDERHAELFARAGVETEGLRVGGVAKLVEAPLAAVADRVIRQWPEAGRVLEAPRPTAAAPGAAGRDAAAPGAGGERPAR